MNKHERIFAGKKVIARRARKLGLPRTLTAEQLKSLRSTGDIALPKTFDRKSFGSCHWRGQTRYLSRQQLLDRAELRNP